MYRKYKIRSHRRNTYLHWWPTWPRIWGTAGAGWVVKCNIWSCDLLEGTNIQQSRRDTYTLVMHWSCVNMPQGNQHKHLHMWSICLSLVADWYISQLPVKTFICWSNITSVLVFQILAIVNHVLDHVDKYQYGFMYAPSYSCWNIWEACVMK